MISSVTAMPKFMKVCLVLAIIGAIAYFTYDSGYDNGYNAKTSEYQDAYNEALKQKTEEYTKAVAKARRIAERDAQARWERKEQEREVKIVTKEVIEYVDREVKVPVGCNDLAKSVNRLLVDSTRRVARFTRAEAGNRAGITKPMSGIKY